MSVIHVESNEKYLEYLGCDSLVVVKFSADWCGPCKRIAPVYESLSSEYGDAVFLHVDIDLDIEDAKSVRGVPAFKFYKGGKLRKEFAGANVSMLKDTVEDLYYF